MIKYAKINENGQLEYAPRNIPGISNWIEDEAAVLAAGYLPVEEKEVPNGLFVAGYGVEGNKIIPVLADLPAPTYSELRRQSYPPLEEQLDMIYWDKVNGTNNWQQSIASVKTAHPKPAESENKGETENV